jgi:hypothetical protein
LVGKQVRRACATKSDEQNAYSIDALEEQVGLQVPPLDEGGLLVGHGNLGDVLDQQ